MKKYRFEIVYQTKEMIEVADWLRTFDFDMEEIAIKHTVILTSRKEPTVDEIKDAMYKAFVLSEGRLLHIEGGLVE